jgi:hypothetical protein
VTETATFFGTFEQRSSNGGHLSAAFFRRLDLPALAPVKRVFEEFVISARKQKSARPLRYSCSIFTTHLGSCYLMLKSLEIGNMIADGVDAAQSLAKRVETNVRQAAHGRIRNLVVEEIQGQVVVSGQAPSRHAKQLALQAALELLSSTMFSEKITIG